MSVRCISRLRYPLSTMNPITTRRHVSSSTRDYNAALEKLFQLQPNRLVTSLFEKPPSTASATPATIKPPQDLNAAAIPEMTAWLRRAGYSPEDLSRMRHIHVAGTKGKGSVCAYATSMLKKYCAVGTYTSPHLVSPRERIAINGEPVGQDAFARAFFEVWDRFTRAGVEEGMEAEKAEGPASKPFYFRYLTIMAWHIFLREGIKDVVMECGIGGEYDATNVLPASAVSAAVVTQLGIDHVAMLGDTAEKIAWHKAGVFKSGVKGFTMNVQETQPGVMEVLRTRAREKGAALVEVDEEAVERWGGVDGLLKGDFQKRNQALALLAVQEHLGMGSNDNKFENIPEKMAEGLHQARLRGRCEVIDDGRIQWLLDGAHTKESLEEVAKWFLLQQQGDESSILIFNQQERDAAQLLRHFVNAVKKKPQGAPLFHRALFTRNDVFRADVTAGEPKRDVSIQEQAAAAMRELVPGCETSIFHSIEDAVAEARRLVEGEAKSKVLVTGSLHLVGGVLQVLEPESAL